MKNRAKSKKQPSKIEVGVRLPKDYPWKVVSKLLTDLQEYVSTDEAEMMKEIIRKRDFQSYLALSDAWGLQSITPNTDIGVETVRTKYLLASLLKKFQFPSDQKKRAARAAEIFFAAESACMTYNQTGYKELAEPETDWGIAILHHARVFLKKLLGDRLPGHREMLSRSRHGPGATIGTEKGNTSSYHKYSRWPYHCTIDAYRYAKFAIETDQRWIGALQDSYRSRMGIPMHMPICLKEFWSAVIKVVDSNKITFVPKDAQKERTIAIEPILNLYLQLGVDGYIRKRLKRWGVDLDNQTKNQDLAFRGSIVDDESSSVTLDLSAASDSISTKLCEVLLPREWYDYLMDLRSPNGFLGTEKLSYEKISSMGNGYTFALESALFTAIIYAVVKADGKAFCRDEVAVFGDDLIVPKRYYFKTVEALRLSGFSINLEKTFSSGPIRESCGTDWFRGMALRPVFFDHTPTSVQELFCDINRLKRLLSLRWGINEGSSTLKLLESWIPDQHKLLIGPYSDEDFDSYLHTAMPRLGMYKQCVYKYQRLIVKPLKRSGNQFFFRKLMHDLRGEPIPDAAELFDRYKRKVQATGSRFTVTSRNALTVGKTTSVSDIWRSEYASR